MSPLLTSPATETGFGRLARPHLPFHASWPDGAPRAVGHALKRDKSLAKEELLTIEGQIDEILPDGRYGVRLDNDHRVIVYTAGKMRRFRIRSVVGDPVHVEMTPYDLTRGRLVYREKPAGRGGGPPRRGVFRRR